jgi:hypothetical protein
MGRDNFPIGEKVAAFHAAADELKESAFKLAVKFVEGEIPYGDRAPDEIFAPVALVFASALLEAALKKCKGLN